MKTDKNREMFCFTLFFHLLFLFFKVIIEVYLINPSQYNAPFNLLSVNFAEVRSNYLTGITSSSCRVEAEKVFCRSYRYGFCVVGCLRILLDIKLIHLYSMFGIGGV